MNFFINNLEMEKFMKALKEGDEATCIHILETESIDVHKKDSEMEYREKQYLRQASSIVIASDMGMAKVVELLIQKGANVNDSDYHGLTSLMKASIYDNTDVIEILLLNGANIHEKCVSTGATAILYACLHSNKNALQLLLSRGASANDTTNNGQTCCDVTFNKEIKSILTKWPVTMVVTMYEELLIYNQIYDSVYDLVEFI